MSNQKKIAVVYWSGTGNTEAMANAVVEGAKENGANVSLYSASEFDTSTVADLDAIAFGCPAMGDEVLEESEFEPMFESSKDQISGKNIALFGSYGWGSGEWMTSWEESSKAVGAVLVTESVICNDYPDDEATEKCKELGRKLAE